jgi:hypothetical protein
MKRSLETETEPNITRGTLEGDMKPGDITFFACRGADATLNSTCPGRDLPCPRVSSDGHRRVRHPEMARFYRHVGCWV